MANILVVMESDLVNSIFDGLLNSGEDQFIPVSRENIDEDLILTAGVELIIFECCRDYRSCVVILEQIYTWFENAGLRQCPVVTITDGSLEAEQTLRAARADFFLIMPVSTQELHLAILQSLSV